jgi:hypothetical protein
LLLAQIQLRTRNRPLLNCDRKKGTGESRMYARQSLLFQVSSLSRPCRVELPEHIGNR